MDHGQSAAPITLFRPTPAGVDAHDEDRRGGVLDIQIASSPIELGIVQGFTSYVTNVTGTMQANVRLTGTGYDPHAEGALEVRGGAFEIPQFGTRYTGLDTRIDLQPDVVTVREFKILDSRGFPLTIGGTLAVHERAVGAVDITLQSQAFEIIDNRIADLKLNSDLKLTGELRKPRLEGSVDIENATIHLAELIEQVTANPYAVEADAGLAGADEAARATPPSGAAAASKQPSLFDALDLDVTVVVPDNMVLRGNNLRPANAPIDIGDMNITVGGMIRARKIPGAELQLVGDVNTVRGITRSRAALRDPARRPHPLRRSDELNPTINIRPAASSPASKPSCGAGDDEAARAVVHQQPAARPGGHPVAHRVQPADQRARRGSAGVVDRARNGAGGRLPRHRPVGRSATPSSSTNSRSRPESAASVRR